MIKAFINSNFLNRTIQHIDTKTVIDVNKARVNQPQRLTDDLIDQIAGGWVNAFLNWSRSF
ncbi:XyeA family cyclophane-containing RiPP triceptide [Yersinia aldovae]|uniref:XyeA family cyclophane-containing RiPP triceptide n=1 Tax=Yersinia aldovae TaxID=29483 RepID=UPI0028F408FA|nr:XyeA family cyclophane-containing RiPP triceptide [Yersinia aldovae]